MVSIVSWLHCCIGAWLNVLFNWLRIMENYTHCPVVGFRTFWITRLSILGAAVHSLPASNTSAFSVVNWTARNFTSIVIFIAMCEYNCACVELFNPWTWLHIWNMHGWLFNWGHNWKQTRGSLEPLDPDTCNFLLRLGAPFIKIRSFIVPYILFSLSQSDICRTWHDLFSSLVYSPTSCKQFNVRLLKNLP